MTITHPLHLADCREVLSSLAKDSIALAVTSPPYNCGKDYGVSRDSMPWDEYWQFTREWLKLLLPALIDGGRLGVNLPWWMGKKPRRDVPYAFKAAALDIGYLFLDKIIWVKGDERNVHVSGGFGGGGSGWGTYLSPSGPAIRCASEPILIFSKGSRGRKAISGEGRGACLRGDMTKEEFHAWTVDTWFVRGSADKDHPATFPVKIPRRLLKLYTFPGETVLDPFMGIGTTGLACAAAGRNFIGVEREPRFFAVAEQHIEEAKRQRTLFTAA
jgi:DNA modification methylase